MIRRTASRYFLVVAFTALPGLGAFAQGNVSCASAGARQFDFWIGDWDIRQRILRHDGSYIELPAVTSVSRALDGCALVEHWSGQVYFFWEGMRQPEPMRGLSVRVYDPRSERWSIHWMDTRAPRFGDPYVGRFNGDTGEFFRDMNTPAGPRTGRITFSRVSGDSVSWELAISPDSGRTWQVLWTMAMRRALRDPP